MPGSRAGSRRLQGPRPGRRSKTLLAAHPVAQTLIAAIAEGSPYLWDLVRADPERLKALLETDPDNGFDEALNAAARTVAATKDEDEAMRLLRRMKSQAALLIALADLGGVWPVMEVIRRQTEVADAAVSAAVEFLLADAAAPAPHHARRSAASRRPARA